MGGPISRVLVADCSRSSNASINLARAEPVAWSIVACQLHVACWLHLHRSWFLTLPIGSAHNLHGFFKPKKDFTARYCEIQTGFPSLAIASLFVGKLKESALQSASVCQVCANKWLQTATITGGKHPTPFLSGRQRKPRSSVVLAQLSKTGTCVEDRTSNANGQGETRRCRKQKHPASQQYFAVGNSWAGVFQIHGLFHS